MKLLKSFTIIELLVALALSSIVMLLTIWAFSNSYRYYYKINRNLDQFNHTYAYINRMRAEIDKSDVVEFKFHQYNLYDNDTMFCNYYLDDDGIVRSDDFRSDTLHCEISAIDTSCVFSPKGDAIISDIRFNLKLNTITIFIHLRKNYYSGFLYNLNSRK
jgi:type II secretory pathway pseudopilin PulG